MSEKILILGSNHPDTALAYKKFHLPQSTLVDKISMEFEIGHTARQEFSTDAELEKVLSNADKVFWADPDWKDFQTKQIYYEFLEWLKSYQNRYKNIVNFEQIKVDPYLWKYDPPTLSKDDIVFLGCSFTEGFGLSDPDTHYATIVAKHFNKNKMNLAEGGSSNYRSFDIFGQLDFCPGQIVVLQLTELARLRYCTTDKKLHDIQLARDKLITAPVLDFLNDDYLLYDQLIGLRLLIKCAREKNLRLVFWLMDYKSRSMYPRESQMYFYEFKEFIPAYLMEDYIIDLAEDNLHPGIGSNQNIANAIIKHLENIYPND